MRCKHNPPCESLQAELLHGVIEWSAGVFAGHGASLNYYPIAYHSGEFWLFQARAVDKGIYTETFEHIDPILTLYIMLLCVRRLCTRYLGTQECALQRMIRWSVCSKVLGFRPMSKVKSSQERDFVHCVQRLGWKI